ncbi:MAG: C25 family cysteine peptidase, partial [Candidatus Eiseniibacteriota bacterium]
MKLLPRSCAAPTALPTAWHPMRRPATIGTLAILAVVLLSPAPRAGAADVATRQLETLAFSPDAVRFQARDSAADGGIVVTLPGCERLAAPGQPDLPSRIVWVELGAGETLRGVRAAATATVTLGTHRIAPVAGEASFADRAGGGWATVGYEGFLRGRRLAAVLVHPFRWQPDTGELELARAIEVELELADAAPGDRALERHRIVPEIERRLDRALGGRLDAAPAPVTAAGPAARAAAATDGGPAAPGPYQPTFRPTPDGSPVEYVIITADSLAGEFERLAAWKTRKGVQAVVRSVEWIEATYPSGADRAERIRFFIQDAYQNWGTLFVLLGGDTELIPARYVESILLNGESIPADYYYACLDGDWNADGDSRFGEGSSILGPGDAADLLFDVSVGRAPVTTVAETQVFIDKTLAYELRAPDAGSYPASILALAEFPWIFELCDDVLPPWFEIRRLYVDSAQYPGSDELTRASALAAINQGYGIVQHNGHGYRNTMSVGEGTLVNADIAGLTNGNRTSVVLANNCSSAAIDFNAIGEAWLHNPNGGAVAYIGTSRRSWQIPADVYQLDWYDRVFVDSVSTVALATDVARLSLIPNAEPDNATRWNLMATLVLGDPELDIYLNAVAPLEVAHADTVELGPLPYEVTVSSGGEPVADATVTLRREGEAYARASTDASGVASLAFAPQTAGEATLTVHRTHYAVYEAVIQVESTASPYPFVAAVTIDDDDQGESNGDGDGLADAGETIELVLTIENGGGAAATGLEATITAEDSLGVVTITTDSVVHGTIDPGGSSTGNGAFVIAIDPSAPEAYQPVIVVAIDSNEGNWEDVTVLPLRRPFLEHERHTIDDAPPRGNGNGAVEPGETIWYTITLRNRGQHDLPAVACTLRTLGSDSLPHPLVTVTDSLADFDPIDVGASVTGDRFEFQLDAGADPASLLLGVTFGMAPYAPLVQLLDVMPPGAADTLQAFGSPTSITLRWSPPGDDDVLGYEVSRGDGPSGPFTRLNPDLLRGGAVYEDRDLPALTRFYYRIVTRDSSYNASPVSEVVSGTTNPPLHPGWPVSVGQQSSSSVTAVDFDRSHRLELFVGAEMQYAYHHDATEVRNGDDSTITNGPYSLRGYDALKGFSATQAIGDLERDGDPEIANVGFTLAQDSLFVWDHEGQVIDGFPKWLMDDFNFASPAMADLDRDGDLEIVVWAGKGGRLFAWHHDGTEVADGDANPDTDGVLYRVFSTSFNFASPAVGNLDMDDSLEVVVAVNINSADSTGAVYAVNLDGSLVDG